MLYEAIKDEEQVIIRSFQDNAELSRYVDVDYVDRLKN